MASLYRLAEQAKQRVPSQPIQVLIADVKDCYGVAAKREWFLNKAEGTSEIDGSFVFTFGKTDPLIPVLDSDTDQYYINVPSSYLRLPNETGIVSVGYMKGGAFARIASGSSNIWSNLKAYALGGLQPYYQEGTRLYFPKMDSNSLGNILLKLAVALDTTDVEKDINIPPDMSDMIVNMVVQKYGVNVQS